MITAITWLMWNTIIPNNQTFGLDTAIFILVTMFMAVLLDLRILMWKGW